MFFLISLAITISFKSQSEKNKAMRIKLKECMKANKKVSMIDTDLICVKKQKRSIEIDIDCIEMEICRNNLSPTPINLTLEIYINPFARYSSSEPHNNLQIKLSQLREINNRIDKLKRDHSTALAFARNRENERSLVCGASIIKD